jgi:hypothetical protein
VDDVTAPQMFTAAELSSYIDAAGGDVRAAAGTVWGVKASRFAGLVDVTEGASSRKNSQLHAQALKMAEYFSPGSSDGGSVTVARSRTRPIVRP